MRLLYPKFISWERFLALATCEEFEGPEFGRFLRCRESLICEASSHVQNDQQAVLFQKFNLEFVRFAICVRTGQLIWQASADEVFLVLRGPFPFKSRSLLDFGEVEPFG